MGLFGKGGDVTRFLNSSGFQDFASGLGAASAFLDGDSSAFSRLRAKRQAPTSIFGGNPCDPSWGRPSGLLGGFDPEGQAVGPADDHEAFHALQAQRAEEERLRAVRLRSYLSGAGR